MEINPQAAGLSKIRLERITDHLQRNYIDTGKLSGCQTLVARKGVVSISPRWVRQTLNSKSPSRMIRFSGFIQ